MPSRNILRIDTPESYYHVYARGASKQPVFLDANDKDQFISLFDRYLSKDVRFSKEGIAYPNYAQTIELLAFCLMDNHFHLFVYQKKQGALVGLMRSLMTSYVRYFNLRHKRSGSLFESRYKSSRILDESYLQHISRYIHLNPRSWKYYPYSSINFYRKGEEPDWICTKHVLSLFSNREDYLVFLSDYEERRDILEEIKHELAE